MKKIKVCRVCKSTKPIDKFEVRGFRCKECAAEYTRAYYQRNKNRLLEYQRDRYHRNRHYGLRFMRFCGCVDCGVTDERVLSFDHTDPSTKTKAVTAMYIFGRERLKEEMRKCRVRCRNCHAIKEYDAQGYSGISDYAKEVQINSE